MRKQRYVIASLCIALGILWTGMGSGEANKVYAADVVGDVDGSTTVDADDVTSLLIELVNGSAVDTANDTNADSALDVKDLMRLQKYVMPADTETAWLDEANKKTDKDGTEYYEITNWAELYGLSTVENCDKTIRLAADIVLNVDSAFKTGSDGKVSGVGTGLVKQWSPIKNFTGTFDGQGHTISGLYVLETTQGAGLFKQAVNATIQDFRMTNSYIKTFAWYIGSVAGEFSGTMQNVFSDATVVTNSPVSGGLVGCVTAGNGETIKNCWFDGVVDATKQQTGGLVGLTQSTLTMNNCLVTGTVKTTYADDDWMMLGGLLGNITGGNVTVSDSLFAGTVTAGASTTPRAGAIIGRTKAASGTITITNTYGAETGYDEWASGTITAVDGIGVLWGVENTQITGAATIASADSFKDINADTNTNLDFTASSTTEEPTWIAQDGTYPILGCFADMATARLLDVSWYYDNADGTFANPYVIDSVRDLYGFNAVANDKNVTFDDKYVQLNADITLNEGNAENWGKTAPENVWTPIKSFEGTFDGQGHTISGVYINDGVDSGVGFFSTVSGATIQDFRMGNSYVNSTKWYTGSIAGTFNGTMQNVFSGATVVTNKPMAGGLVGYVKAATRETIKNCWFDGVVDTSNYTAGGLVGGTEENTTNLTVENCLVTGELHSSCDNQNPQLGGLIGLVADANGSQVTVSGCLFAGSFNCTGTQGRYYVGEILGRLGLTNKQNVTLIIENTYGIKVEAPYYNTATAVDQVAGIGQVWGVANANITGAATVASADSFKDINADANTNLDFTASSTSEEPTWIVQDGTYPILGCFADMATARLLDVSWYYNNAEGSSTNPYVIDSVRDLYGFNAVANDKNVTFDDKYVQLNADITLNEENAENWGTTAPENVWTPIKNFMGTFDGQQHTISGVYVSGTNKQGFFATVTEGTIKNMRMTNSLIKATSYCAGSIAGMFSGNIQDVFSNASVVTEGDYVGGFVGQLNPITGGSSSISGCWYDGNINTLGKYVGGVAGGTLEKGDATAVSMTNCLVTGTLCSNFKDNTPRLGGFLGIMHSNGDDVTVSNSLFAGTFNCPTGLAYYRVGEVVGQIGITGQQDVKLTITDTHSVEMGALYLNDAASAIKVAGIGQIWGVDNAKIIGAADVKNRVNFTSENPKTTTNFDFTTPIWVTVPNRTPVLKAFEDLVEKSDLSVMTYNVRSGVQIGDIIGVETEKLWNHRKAYVFAGIQASNPDIIGFQELYDGTVYNAYSDVNNELTRLGYESTSSNINTTNPIFYKSDSYTKVGEGNFALLANPEDEQRYCVYVVLQHKETGNKFLVGNTHYSTFDEPDEKLEGSNTIIATLPGIMQEHGVTSMMLMGDFNGSTGNQAFKAVVEALDLLNCKYQTTSTVDCHTLNNWGTPVNTIDHILISKTGFDVQYYNVDNALYGDNKDEYASDHYPVIVGLDF